MWLSCIRQSGMRRWLASWQERYHPPPESRTGSSWRTLEWVEICSHCCLFALCPYFREFCADRKRGGETGQWAIVRPRFMSVQSKTGNHTKTYACIHKLKVALTKTVMFHVQFLSGDRIFSEDVTIFESLSNFKFHLHSEPN